MKTNNNSGIILVAVVCFTAITAILVAGLLSESGSQLKLADRNVNTEQAFYVAEGGAERAVSCIRNSGGAPPGVITGAIGNGTYSVAINSGGAGGVTTYTISSTGTVNGVEKSVIMSGVRQDTWARYALAYDRAFSDIIIQQGDHFFGPFHANCAIELQGNIANPIIFDQLVSTTASNWISGSVTSGVTFNEGWQFNAQSQNMAAISFPALRSNAFLIVTGATSIRFSNTNLFISNSNRNWDQTNYAASNSNLLSSGTGLIYVASSGSGAGTNRGTVSVAGTNLDGRLTIVADGDIQITNHITYANTNITPGLTNTSDDALGLIASNDVVITRYAPDTLNIYAHIIAKCPTNSFSHGFYVQGYGTYHSGGYLNVYGGIVEYTRGAVSQYGHGYLKNYQYDTRFADNPPPSYPVLTNQYIWGGWQDK